MKKLCMVLACFIMVTSAGRGQVAERTFTQNEDALKPWSEDARYWQYKGSPVMLLGGSKTDHIFLAEGLKAHLDDIQAAGGNYVRNTMSQREPIELKPYLLRYDGKFDLDNWNLEYWSRFANMLKWTAERDIFVQIEVWDRFDFSKEFWEISPWNPAMNINYTHAESGFDKDYPLHPSRDKQPFFHSIPGMPQFRGNLDLIRHYQEAFVAKMLSYSLEYDHVLYCMNNETSTPPAWGQYWIEFILAKAADEGKKVFVTDMFDDAHKGEEAEHTLIVFKDPDHYMFADISQVNSRNFGEDHWKELLWLIQQVNENDRRPSNHTKIYGGGYKSFGTGGLEDGVERFWRNILGGSASARFHRPDSGNGFNDRTRASIKAARLVESKIKFWDIEPHTELLSDRDANEAYLAASPGESYLIYFTYGGNVGLDLSAARGDFEVLWISVTEGRWLSEKPTIIQGGAVVEISAPFKGGWVAMITKKAV
ncbi:MAG: hypothetical protein HKN87_22480 [Saprospiraceae bacterium]|nr:hypothetical protein [Saprospiraceae bacterium]